MQSTTIVPTSIGIIQRTPDMSTSDPSWEMSTSCRPPALSSGRLRLDVPMFVWIVPGHRTVAPTLEPSSSSSFASTSVSPRTPYFVSVYEPRPGMPSRPAMEEVFTMCPPSWLPFRIGRKAWMPWMTPHRFTPTIHFQSSSVRSAMRPIGPMPALLTSTCAVPKRSTTSVASAPTLSASDTSVWMPVAPSSLAVRCSAPSSMSAMTSSAPSFLSASAMPLPMPDAPPVTTATFPSRSANADMASPPQSAGRDGSVNRTIVSVSPQRKDAARNREAILDAARELMARSSDFPLYEVARRAGVGQATLYRHFPDRATLAATLARELHEEIGAAVAEHAGRPDAFDRLLDVIAACAIRSHGLTDVVRESPEAWREMERMRDELIDLVEGPLDQAKATGRVARDVRAEDVFLLLAMIDGALTGVVEQDRRREIAERVRDLAARGMAG